MPAVAKRTEAAIFLNHHARGATSVCVQVDPMVTVLTSLVEFCGPLTNRIPAGLHRSMTSAARGVPIPLLRMLTMDAKPHTFDFVASVDVASASSFGERLEQVRATSLGDLDEEFSAYDAIGAGTVKRWRQDTGRMLADYCSALQAYWRAVVEPHYPNLEQRLGREAERLAMAIQEYGDHMVLGSLHPGLRLRGESLFLRSTHYAVPRAWTPKRLIIKPMVAARATTFSNIGAVRVEGTTDAVFAASPPALRPGWPATTNGVDDLDGLSLLIGRSRACIVRSLRHRPGTTTDLADEFALTPGTVSHHLSVLQQAGVVRRLRRGSSVFYMLNDRGIRLAAL